jgi:hypothetical protein
VRHDQKVAQNIIDVMAACILLKRLKGMNPAEQQKLEYDWNESYLLISETLSQLEEEQEDLAPISERAHQFAELRRKSFVRAGQLIRSPLFLGALVVVALLCVAIGAPVMGFYDIRDIRNDVPFTRKFYNPAINTIRVAFPGIPYASLEEVKQKNPQYAPVDPTVRGSLINGVGEAAFAELTNRGFPREHFQTFLNLIQKNRGFKSTVYTTGPDSILVEHVILFDTVEDAKVLEEIRRENMDNRITPEQRHNIEENLTLCRRANMWVVLELSNPDYRATFAEEKWGFKESEYGI